MYAYFQAVPIDAPLYWKVIDNIGSEPIAGSVLHLCVRKPDGGLRYIDVWESEEACGKAFDERIHHAVDAAFGGARPGTEPTVTPVDLVHMTGADRIDRCDRHDAGARRELEHRLEAGTGDAAKHRQTRRVPTGPDPPPLDAGRTVPAHVPEIRGRPAGPGTAEPGSSGRRHPHPPTA